MCWSWLFGDKKIISAGNKSLCKRNIFELRTVGVTKIIFEKYGAFFFPLSKCWRHKNNRKTAALVCQCLYSLCHSHCIRPCSFIVLPSWCWQYWATLRFIFFVSSGSYLTFPADHVMLCCVVFGEGRNQERPVVQFQEDLMSSLFTRTTSGHPSLLSLSLPPSQSLASPGEERARCSFSGHDTMEAWWGQHRAALCLALCMSQFVADWQCWDVR